MIPVVRGDCQGVFVYHSYRIRGDNELHQEWENRKEKSPFRKTLKIKQL
jgi:hypothetical protein